MNNEGYQRQVEASLPGCEQVALDGCVTGVASSYKETSFRREKLLCLYAIGLIFFHNSIIAYPKLVVKVRRDKPLSLRYGTGGMAGQAHLIPVSAAAAHDAQDKQEEVDEIQVEA